MKILVCIGTRPEAIKMAPVIKALQSTSRWDTQVVLTSQHRELLTQAMLDFDVRPDRDLGIMRPNQRPEDVISVLAHRLPKVIEEFTPNLVLVHGDTTTALAAAMVAFHVGVDVAHVEAGLRSGSAQSPFPEEFNRRAIAAATNLHFAPTDVAASNLLREGVPEHQIHVTGNSVVDAIDWMRKRLSQDSDLVHSVESKLRSASVPSSAPIVLVTCHRRENQGAGMARIFRAVRRLAQQEPRCSFVVPVHPSPAVQRQVHSLLSGAPNVLLLQPQDYATTVYLLEKCVTVMTDSGGLQEESAVLGKPTIVFREVTERPETLDAGSAVLVGSDTDAILESGRQAIQIGYQAKVEQHARKLLGDGHAARRIVDVLSSRAALLDPS